MPSDCGNQIMQQLGAVDRRRPRFRLGKGQCVSLFAVIAKFLPLGFNNAIEDGSSHLKPLCRGFADAIVFNEIKPSEPSDLELYDLGFIVPIAAITAQSAVETFLLFECEGHSSAPRFRQALDALANLVLGGCVTVRQSLAVGRLFQGRDATFVNAMQNGLDRGLRSWPSAPENTRVFRGRSQTHVGAQTLLAGGEQNCAGFGARLKYLCEYGTPL
jgi:hypothetical protein